MADGKPIKVRFLTRAKYGFKADTPGHEVNKLGDNWVYSYQVFEDGDEFEFPACEIEGVKGLVADGIGVVVGSAADKAAAESGK